MRGVLRFGLCASMLMVLAAGCGSADRRYNGEYLRSARELERALAESPRAANRTSLERRVKHLHQLHEAMLQQERNRARAEHQQP